MDSFTLQNKSISVIAKRNSGKSVLIKYLLKYAISEKQFDKIYVICPTNDINHFYNDIVNQNNIMNIYNEEWVSLLIDKMSKINDGKTSQKDKPYNVMLVLDDLANEKAFHHSKTIRQLYGRGRHSFISLICVGQQLHNISPLQRNNSGQNNYLICGQLNAQNISLLCDEFRAPIINKKDFIELYKQCTQNYLFMVINNNTVDDINDINSYYGSIKAQI